MSLVGVIAWAAVIATIAGALIWLIYKKDKQAQRYSWIHCPRCKHDLNGDDKSLVRDDPLEGTFYLCSKCGLRSHWDLNAPVPLFIGRWPKHTRKD